MIESLGYDVAQAHNGPAALAVLRSGKRFDLLLTDIDLPEGINGLQLAKAAQALQPGLNVLLCTGYETAIPEGISLTEPLRWPILYKPFRRSDLAASIQAAMAA